MIPVFSNCSLKGMSTANFNNIIANPNQTSLPISALGNILQLHCNPSLTLQVNGTSPLVPVSTRENVVQDQMTTQINTLRSIYPSQLNYNNVSQTDQCKNSSQKNFNQLIQEVLLTYQDQQDSLSQVTIKYNFLLNAMERLLFDVQNNVEYSLLALGISQAITKVKLNQINPLNQLNCASLISNRVISMINDSQLLSNCTQLSSTQPDVGSLSSVIDLTNQRIKSDLSTEAAVNEKQVEKSKIDFYTLNSSMFKKMINLDNLDKIIDETVKKSTNRSPVLDGSCQSPVSNSQVAIETSEAPYNMGDTIQKIIHQFYQNSSLNHENVTLNGTTITTSSASTESSFTDRSHLENGLFFVNNFNPQISDVVGNSTISSNNTSAHTNHSFILCNDLLTNSTLNTRREPLVISMSTTPKEMIPQNVNDFSVESANNLVDEIESIDIHDDDNIVQAELDPNEVATRVRDILSLHSIGQRLFAKHVLNLSQGTVSELLSKPKPWSKLSEKGRDSYRKMNQWIQDTNRLQELKSIAPRKGFSGYYTTMSPVTPFKEDHETQEKIKRILNDAKMAMASTRSNLNVNVDVEPFKYNNISNDSKISNECFQIPSNYSNNHGIILSNDISSNVMELNNQIQHKTAASQSNVTSRSLRTDSSLPHVSPPSNRQDSPLILMNFANLIPSSLIMNPLSATNQSITRLVNTHIITDNKMLEDSNDLKPEPPKISQDNMQLQNINNIINEDNTITNQSLSDKIDLKSVFNINPKSSTEQENVEKLIQSSVIQNEDSLQYEEINTTALIKLVKEHLTKNSISQRTFGCLLGLSQGSISDILSRPKQWSLLTNKGKEPYIRMLKYLFKPNKHENDDNETSKMENITSEFSTLNNQFSDSLPSPVHISEIQEDFETVQTFCKDQLNENLVLSDDTENLFCQDSSSISDSRSCSIEKKECDSFDEDTINTDREISDEKFTNIDHLDMENWNFDDSKERLLNLIRKIVDLDTISISNTVKEILIANNMGQKHFGECILNVSQGSVSELLTKPKSWNQLSFKGKESYVRMQLWLRKSDKVKILINSQNNCQFKQDSNNHSEDSMENLALNQKDKSDIGYEILINNNCERHISTKSFPRINKCISKRGRILFSESQKAELLSIYGICPYPNSKHLEEISKKLNIPLKTISNWFHNYRMRNKNARCLTVSCTNKHRNGIESVVNKTDSLSLESKINSKKSLTRYKTYKNDQCSLDESESEGSATATSALYHDEKMSLNCVLKENSSNETNYIEEDSERICLSHSINFSVQQNSGGSNKRKRANPIKLEIDASKLSNKDLNVIFSQTEDIVAISEDKTSMLKGFQRKLQKLE